MCLCKKQQNKKISQRKNNATSPQMCSQKTLEYRCSVGSANHWSINQYSSWYRMPLLMQYIIHRVEKTLYKQYWQKSELANFEANNQKVKRINYLLASFLPSTSLRSVLAQCRCFQGCARATYQASGQKFYEVKSILLDFKKAGFVLWDNNHFNNSTVTRIQLQGIRIVVKQASVSSDVYVCITCANDSFASIFASIALSLYIST